MKYTIPTKISFLQRFPSLNQIGEKRLWIVDKVVYKKNPHLRRWLKKEKSLYLVNAGEKLKDIQFFPAHMKNILNLSHDQSHHQLVLIAIGGGSVGDFAGFVAATYKRGIRFIQIPSTWLAAIDSAHGGKNALNVGTFKNQVGTFYHPDQVIMIRELLFSQPHERLQDGLGEAYKMALITQAPWTLKCLHEKKLNEKTLWQWLPNLIRGKYSVVAKDPLEKTGHRFILNLGHTLAHALELENNLSHGVAVTCGLHFALWLSHRLQYLSNSEYQNLQQTPMYSFIEKTLHDSLGPLSAQQFQIYVTQDKKKTTSDQIRFVFLKKRGKAQAAPLLIKDLVAAYSEWRKEIINVS